MTWFVVALVIFLSGIGMIVWGNEVRARLPVEQQQGVAVGRLAGGILMVCVPIVFGVAYGLMNLVTAWGAGLASLR